MTASCVCATTAPSLPRFPTANSPTKPRSTIVRTPRPPSRPDVPAPRRVPDAPMAVQDARFPLLLASGDVCSKKWIWEQYDYQVRTNTVAGPGAEAAIIRIKETGTSVAMSLDGNGRYCYLSPREGAKLAVAECCRNLATAGAMPVAATNNLNFGNPERPEIMAQLVEAIEGMSEACIFFETPITGGNVSLYNETLGTGIYPTPVMGIVGTLKTSEPVTIPFKNVKPAAPSSCSAASVPATISISAAPSTPRSS